jgi:PAS domain S-box-containing protein
MRVALQLLAVIVSAEVSIMLLFSWLGIDDVLSPLPLAIADAFLLSAVIAFPLYYWFIRPLKSTIRTSQAKLGMLASAVENAGDGIIITRRDGAIEYVNQAFREMSGYSDDELIGKQVASIEDYMATTEWKEQFLRSIRHFGVWKGEQWEKRRNGEKYLAEITVTPIDLTSSGKITHFVTIKQDNTKRHKLENQLRHAQKMEAVGTLVGGIAHDFNNMLSGLTGQLYLAKGKIKDNEEVYERLTKMEALTFRAADMVNQLLTFARKGAVNKTNLVINSFIKEASKLAQVGLPENIEFHCDITDERMVAYADATQLQQVMMNLINNARDAVDGREHPVIQVTLDGATPEHPSLSQFNPTESRYAELCVMDNGCGIKKEHLSRIMEPFFTTKEQGKGTGLGLAMVHGVVQSYHGFVAVESEEGGGTAFRFFLPLVEAASDETGEMEVIHQGHGEFVLLVDDDVIVRETGREVLEQLGYNVFVAEDGDRAVRLCREYANHISAVIMDVVMPHVQGGEAAIQIKKICPGLPIVLATGYDKSHVVDESVLSVIEGIISKPYSPERLSSVLHELLRGNVT